ncbi:polyprenol reductase 2-like [Quillaja saponaria]|uniref:Polyprenol reductase 2-like n=1 Tax=Quillaja saponaria TaxID=32244 RepID=A0AAD7QBN4_QUISA|nr:polyprenol reductase 2-like [Quillaja saponaria]
MEVGLVQLLRAVWIAGTLSIIIASLPTSRLSSFRAAMLGFAKRGKIMNSSSNKFTVPQRCFLHFYSVAVVWTTFLVVTTWIYASRMAPIASAPFIFSTITSYLIGGSHIFSSHESPSTQFQHSYVVWRAVFLLLLMEVQVLRRLFETIYVFSYSPSARMHIFGYLTGFFFYTAVPLSMCCDLAPGIYKFTANQVTDFIVKSKNQMPAVEFAFSRFVGPFVNLGWPQWLGAAIFFWGWMHQCRCHAILGLIRAHSKQLDKYAIPHGDWFEIVSSPHYFSEIVIYAGLLVASGGANLTIWLLFCFVVANLAFAAAETQRWYFQKFEDYPRSRFAIIPFIF